MNATALATGINDVLARYVAVDKAIYGVPFWRNLRRIIPIPGVFEAIPYPLHAATLAGLRDELREYGVEAAVLTHEGNARDHVRIFARQLTEYVSALDTAMSQLENLCVLLASKATRQDALPFRDYKRLLADYRQSQQAYVTLGSRLNTSFRSL